MSDEPVKVSPEEPEETRESQEKQQERARALALLQATHQFPVLYEVSVITLSSPEIYLSVRQAARLAMDADDNHEIVPSKGGKYTSHRIKVHCSSADAVLELYARLRALSGVVTLL